MIKVNAKNWFELEAAAKAHSIFNPEVFVRCENLFGDSFLSLSKRITWRDVDGRGSLREPMIFKNGKRHEFTAKQRERWANHDPDATSDR